VEAEEARRRADGREIQRARDWIKATSATATAARQHTRDDAGIQQVVNCSELKREFHALERQEAAARDYLATGLPEECRRAGCLPGGCADRPAPRVGRLRACRTEANARDPWIRFT
jgi:hypothetical protein